jgi:hypothetical protein
MASSSGPRIPRNNLVCAYDASNSKSYPGSGTTWFDLSGNGNNLTLSSSERWNSNGSRSYMDFTAGIAKYLPGGTLDNIPGTGNTAGTICIFSTIKGPDSDWKTLVRGDAADPDHQVIIQESNGIDLGMYDNDGAGFLDSGFNVDTLSNRTTEYHFMAWKLNTSSPYYEFFYDSNLSTAAASITNASATFNSGFASVGGYHNGSSSPTSFSQEWGSIRMFLFYNKHLSEQELREVYNSYKSRL